MAVGCTWENMSKFKGSVYVFKDQDAADAGGKPMHMLNMSNIMRSFVNGIVVAMGRDAKPKPIIIYKKEAHEMVNANAEVSTNASCSYTWWQRFVCMHAR